MTEEQAKKKWCPMVREFYNDGFVGGSRNRGVCGIIEQVNYCIASDCMMWKWEVYNKYSEIKDILEREDRLLKYYSLKTQPPIYTKEKVEELKQETKERIEELNDSSKYGYCGLTSNA